jgi:hypothetical protein
METEREKETEKFTTGSQISTIPFQPPPLQLAGLSPQAPPPPFSVSVLLSLSHHRRYMVKHTASVGPRQEIYKIDEDVAKMRKEDKTDRKGDGFTVERKNWEYSGCKTKVKRYI